MSKKLKKFTALFSVLTLVIVCMFSFPASAIILEHEKQFIASNQIISVFTVPTFSTSKSWTHDYKINSINPSTDLASAYFGISKGGITRADNAVSGIDRPISGIKMIHSISRNYTGNTLVDEDESIGYQTCSATANGKLWSAAKGWFHQCAINQNDVACVYIWAG